MEAGVVCGTVMWEGPSAVRPMLPKSPLNPVAPRTEASGCPHVWCRHHRGAITSLVISPDGNFLFSSCSRGSLVQYDCAAPQCCVLRVAGQAPSSHSGWSQGAGRPVPIS
jgi:hypothetical protein